VFMAYKMIDTLPMLPAYLNPVVTEWARTSAERVGSDNFFFGKPRDIGAIVETQFELYDKTEPPILQRLLGAILGKVPYFKERSYQSQKELTPSEDELRSWGDWGVYIRV